MFRFRSKAIVPVWMLLLGSATVALPAQATSLIEIYRAALARDAIWGSAQAAYRANLEAIPQAAAALGPSLQANASAAYLRAKPYGSPDTTGASLSAGLSASLPLYHPADRVLLEQARARQPAVEATLAAARQELGLRVVQAYLSALLAEQNLAATRSQKEALARQLAQAKRTYEVGSGTVTDLYDAQARYDLIVATELQNEVALKLAKQALDVLPGSSTGSLEPVQWAPPLAQLVGQDLQSWVSAADEHGYPVQQARANARAQHLEIDHARAAWKPTIELTADLAEQHYSQANLNLINNGSRTAQIAVVLNLPIWEAGLRDSRLRQALAQAEQSDQDLEASRRSTNLLIRQAYTSLETGAAQVAALEQAVKSNEVSVNASVKGNEIGARTQADVLNARQQLFQAQLQLLGARYGSVLALFQLKAAAGQLEEADILALSGGR